MASNEPPLPTSLSFPHKSLTEPPPSHPSNQASGTAPRTHIQTRRRGDRSRKGACRSGAAE